MLGSRNPFLGSKKQKYAKGKKLPKKQWKGRQNLKFSKNLNGRFKTALNVEWRFQDLQVPSLVGPPQL